MCFVGSVKTYDGQTMRICVYACMSAVLCALCDFVCFVLRRSVGAVCVRATECGMRAGWSEKGKGLSQFKL